MTLRAMPLLTDENVHPEVLAFLEAEGLDVLDVKREGLWGTPDHALLKRGLDENRGIVTHDSDFGRLAFAMNTPYLGVLYLRPGHVSAAFHIATLRHLLAQSLDVRPPFTVVAQQRTGVVTLRIRQFAP